VDEEQDVVYLTPITDQPIPVDWEAAQEAGFCAQRPGEERGAGGAVWRPAGNGGEIQELCRMDERLCVLGLRQPEAGTAAKPSTGQVSRAGESERDFRVRLQQSTREQRDDTTEALRKKYAPKISALQEKIRKAEQAVDREADQAKSSGMQTALSFGSTLLGAFLGRKKISSSTIGKAATSMKSASRTAQQKRMWTAPRRR